MSANQKPSNGILDLFKSAIDDIVSEYEGTPTLLLFQGASQYIAHIVLSHPKAIKAPEEGWLDGNGFVDPDVLVSRAKHVFREVAFASDNVIVGLYENYVPIRGSLRELYDGNIVIVKNNLFAEKHPSPFAPKHLEPYRAMLDAPEKAGDCDEIDRVSAFYSDVTRIGAIYLVSPILDPGEAKIVELFAPEKIVASENKHGRADIMPAPGIAFLEYTAELCNGIVRPVSLSVDESDIEDNICQNDQAACVVALLRKAGIETDLFQASKLLATETNEDRLLPILRKYWGDDASFRMLSFYDSHTESREMKTVSQGHIAEQVVLQSEIALDELDSYRNIFVTAPTGAGKSVLFQIPALYLAKEKGAVTIVIEPLIALMEDQVQGLRARGIAQATALNSNLSFSEKIAEIEKIKAGERSIVYLSPELLLGSKLEDIIGERKLGLVVVDEAHTVAIWGKDFRSDYWFLGGYLTSLRKSGLKFPIFCLTATAVLGGSDDIVYDVMNELELGIPLLFLGNVRRDDISFDIRQKDKADYPGLIESVKCQIIIERIKKAIDENVHTLVYCPFVKHVKMIVREFFKTFPEVPGFAVMQYHGELDKAYKEAASKHFKSGKCRVLVCTTSYGMGINIDDIELVLHYAPTGNLSNYVQEIGRGARRKELSATASIDFFPSDARYFAALHSMSTLSQKQLKEMMKKLHSLYISNNPRRQNLLVAPNSFSYLFGDDKDAVNKTKSALMMIAKDLLSSYGFPVLIVKSNPSYTRNYICIPASIDEEFKSRYSRFVERTFSSRQKELDFNKRNRRTMPVLVRSVGEIYEINTAKMWEECFSSYTFAQFKKKLFEGEIIQSAKGDRPSPRVRLKIKYSYPFEYVRNQFAKYIGALQKTFVHCKTSGHCFTARQFKKEYELILGVEAPFAVFPEKVLDAFAVSPKGIYENERRNAMECLQKNASGGPEPKYRVAENCFLSIDQQYQKKLNKSKPMPNEDAYTTFLSKDSRTCEELNLAVLLELFGLASYEMRGGDNPELFVRLNDPNKIGALANDPRYKNKVLADISRRHKTSKDVITKFFMAEMSDELRWDLIEAYFLGENDEVMAILETVAPPETINNKSNRKGHKERTVLEAQISSQGLDCEGMSYLEIWKDAKNCTEDEDERKHFDRLIDLTSIGRFERPLQAPEFIISGSGATITPILAWQQSKVMLFLEEDAAMYVEAQETDWKCFMTSKSFVPDRLVELIGE